MDIQVNKASYEWQREHCDPFGFADVNTPGDVEYAEWILGDGFSLSGLRRESKYLGIPLERLMRDRFKEWRDAAKKGKK